MNAHGLADDPFEICKPTQLGLRGGVGVEGENLFADFRLDALVCCESEEGPCDGCAVVPISLEEYNAKESLPCRLVASNKNSGNLYASL